VTDISNVRIGGPCNLCGAPQIARAERCPRSRQECAYGKFDAPVTAALRSSRLAAMLRLYIATGNREQRELADEIGINESTLSRYLSGKASPDAEGFSKILVWVLAGTGAGTGSGG